MTTRRFSLVLTSELYEQFYKTFPDYGERSSILRKCVHRLIKKAEVIGGVLPSDIKEVSDEILKKERSEMS